METQMESVLRHVWIDRRDILFACPARGAGRHDYEYFYESPQRERATKLIASGYLSARKYNLYGRAREKQLDNYYDRVSCIANIFQNIGIEKLVLAWDDGDGSDDMDVKASELWASIAYPWLKRQDKFFDGTKHRNLTIAACRSIQANRKLPFLAYRIYINMKLDRDSALRVLQPILRGVTSQKMASVAGIEAVKVAGPLNDTAEAVTLFYGSQSAMYDALDEIRPIAKRHPGVFRPTVKPLTTPVRGLTGISIGVKPPEIKVVKRDGAFVAKKDKTQNFTKIRAELIFQALERTARPTWATKESRSWWYNRSDFGTFKNRVERYFKKAGIDASRPGHRGPNAWQSH